MSKETKTYWVAVSHKTETNYTVEATSKEQVERLFKKMLQDGTVSNTGIDHHSGLMESIGEAIKGGAGVHHWPLLRSLRFEGWGDERVEKIEDMIVVNK